MNITAQEADRLSETHMKQWKEDEERRIIPEFSDDRVEAEIRRACMRGEKQCTISKRTRYKIARIAHNANSLQWSETDLEIRIIEIYQECRKNKFDFNWSYTEDDITESSPSPYRYTAELVIRW